MKFDVLVVGSGSGMIVAANAIANEMKTALVEFGPMGGTCINRGCVPSKMLIYPADIIASVRESEQLGIHATVNLVDFKKIMDRMHQLVNGDVERQTKAVEADPNIAWFKKTGEFISDYTMKVGDQVIKADKIFIVSGARPAIPSIKGLENAHFLTSDSLLNLTHLPSSMIIVGGGYIAAEYGHFFSNMGTKVTIVQRSSKILPNEEPEISDLLREEMGKRLEIFTDCEVVEVRENAVGKTVISKSSIDGQLKEFSAETLLVAAGRVPNSDMLKPERTGVDLDKRGYIKVNEYLQTKKKNIWAFGDAIGREMFKHVANYEAQIAWHNSSHGQGVKMDYSAAPHAIFTHPQIASVGLKEEEARQKGRKVLIGKALYKDTAQGAAMGSPEGFVKVVVEQKTGRILGGHIIGPHASMLIQEIVNAMAFGDGTFLPIIRTMHIHPAMNEVIQSAFANLREA